jgi:two-component system NarL family response regulator
MSCVEYEAVSAVRATSAVPIRVLVADDDPFFRRLVFTLLSREHDIVVVGDARDAREAVLRARELAPHVVLLDVVMPEGGGPAAARALRDQHPAIKVVMVTGSDHDADVYDCLKLGARGYVLKQHVLVDLAGAIRTTQQRAGVLLSPTIVTKVLDEFAPAPVLSEREVEVLGLVAQGCTNDDIARELWLSAHTVKRHIANILAKLHEPTRSAAVAHAMRVGLLPPSPQRDEDEEEVTRTAHCL